jgi:diguanylate cyclase (GGDEF)-like protein/PAS domain S-box-containing protein
MNGARLLIAEHLDRRPKLGARAARAARIAAGAAEGALDHAFDDALIGMQILDLEGRYVRVNDAFCSFVGHPRDDLLGLPRERITHSEDVAGDADALRSLLAGESRSHTREQRYVHAAGHVVWASVSVTLVRGDEGEPQYLIGHAHDLTEQRRREQRLESVAYEDPLTGVWNRRRLEDVAADGPEPAGRSVVLIDLDQFKAVNDTYGHHVGDGVLRIVAERLKQVADDGAVLVRLGGDEFAAVLPTGDRSVAQALGTRVHDAIRRPMTVESVNLFINCSIGIATGSGDAPLSLLMTHADASMLHVKRGGTTRRVTVFDPAVHAGMLDALALSIDLRAALSRNELALHYEPIVDMPTRRPLGFEALLRWSHPEQGMIMPGAFIPLAEQSGLMPELGTWVLEQACAQAKAWQERFVDPPFVSVNLSIRQLEDPDFVCSFERTLQQIGLDPQQLTVEITESVFATDLDTVAAPLKTLRGLGVRVLLDDFGTGYSSLGYIRELPLDGVKLDRVFTRDLTVRDDAWTIARAIAGLLGKLGMSLIAEGLESAAHLAQLRSLGCSVGQGYYFARPHPAAELSFEGLTERVL